MLALLPLITNLQLPGPTVEQNNSNIEMSRGKAAHEETDTPKRTRTPWLEEATDENEI
ncbi:9163_t:CDS:2 [Dentiscutata erythropus]|uniref:9163_t:CDS:1 n=1 Tax=Dentiscutata erythropus TaxID=1348616 RepID=A0A9N9NY07_9GLOM|nr:9163_t:CDS:2 [Dentiscutata erythropus]